jgi:hypothetical protein
VTETEVGRKAKLDDTSAVVEKETAVPVVGDQNPLRTTAERKGIT